MNKLKTVSMIIIVSLCWVIISTSASAVTKYCQVKVGDKQCGSALYTICTNRSIDYAGTHKYGGFLGIGAKTCNYTYYYNYYNTKCSKGHIAEAYQTLVEKGHQCGK